MLMLFGKKLHLASCVPHEANSVSGNLSVQLLKTLVVIRNVLLIELVSVQQERAYVQSQSKEVE